MAQSKFSVVLFTPESGLHAHCASNFDVALPALSLRSSEQDLGQRYCNVLVKYVALCAPRATGCLPAAGLPAYKAQVKARTAPPPPQV